MSTIPNLQKSINAWAVRKEWRGPLAEQRPFVADLALFHSEISEALECIRDVEDPKAVWFSYTVEVETFAGPMKFRNLSFRQLGYLLDCESDEETEAAIEELGLIAKPEGVGPELADLMIRVLETAEEYGLDMEFEIDRKMAYNEGREIRHGGKLL